MDCAVETAAKVSETTSGEFRESYTRLALKIEAKTSRKPARNKAENNKMITPLILNNIDTFLSRVFLFRL